MNLNSREGLIARLRRGKEARRQFTESHVNKAIAHQFRAIRDALGWSQERLAKETGMNQNAISRLESVDYGKPTITTLKRVAAAFDVSLIVRFAPFSEVVDWVSGTPRVNEGLTSDALAVPTFTQEEVQGVFAAHVSAAHALPNSDKFAKLVKGQGQKSREEDQNIPSPKSIVPKENILYAQLRQQQQSTPPLASEKGN